MGTTRLAFFFAEETRADVVGVWHNLHFLNLELVRMRHSCKRVREYVGTSQVIISSRVS